MDYLPLLIGVIIIANILLGRDKRRRQQRPTDFPGPEDQQPSETTEPGRPADDEPRAHLPQERQRRPVRIEPKKNDGPLSWEEMERQYGIRMERPSESNQQVLQGNRKALPKTDYPASATGLPPSPPAPSIPEKSSPRADSRKTMSEPAMMQPGQMRAEAKTALSVKQNGRMPARQSSMGHPQMTGTGLAEAFREPTRQQLRAGIIWAEILMPPMSKRKPLQVLKRK